MGVKRRCMGCEDCIGNGNTDASIPRLGRASIGPLGLRASLGLTALLATCAVVGASKVSAPSVQVIPLHSYRWMDVGTMVTKSDRHVPTSTLSPPRDPGTRRMP